MRWDWLPHAVVALAAAGSACLLVGTLSRAWGERWSVWRRWPSGRRWLVALALAWLGLRVARFGWRPFIGYVGTIALLAAWGEIAARDLARRRARASRETT